MAFFRIPDKKQPDKERRLYSLYLLKHKKTPEVKEETFKEEPVHPVLKHREQWKKKESKRKSALSALWKIQSLMIFAKKTMRKNQLISNIYI